MSYTLPITMLAEVVDCSSVGFKKPKIDFFEKIIDGLGGVSIDEKTVSASINVNSSTAQNFTNENMYFVNLENYSFTFVYSSASLHPIILKDGVYYGEGAYGVSLYCQATSNGFQFSLLKGEDCNVVSGTSADTFVAFNKNVYVEFKGNSSDSVNRYFSVVNGLTDIRGAGASVPFGRSSSQIDFYYCIAVKPHVTKYEDVVLPVYYLDTAPVSGVYTRLVSIGNDVFVEYCCLSTYSSKPRPAFKCGTLT